MHDVRHATLNPPFFFYTCRVCALSVRMCVRIFARVCVHVYTRTHVCARVTFRSLLFIPYRVSPPPPPNPSLSHFLGVMPSIIVSASHYCTPLHNNLETFARAIFTRFDRAANQSRETDRVTFRRRGNAIFRKFPRPEGMENAVAERI